MISENEEELKKRLEEAMANAINGIIETFREYPMFYLNEEDIRCDLYRKVSDDYPSHKIFLKNPYNDSFISNAIHADAIVKMPKEKTNPKKQKPDLLVPDLLVYFAKNTRNDPIPVDKVKDRKKPEKIHFLAKSNEKHNKKRILVEIKFTGHSKEISEGKIEGIKDDLEKLSEWESWKKYMLYFDRSNEFDVRIIGLDKNGNVVSKTELKKGNFYKKLKLKDYIIGLMEKMPERNEGDIEFYYMGMPKPDSEKKEQIYHYVNGILKR